MQPVSTAWKEAHAESLVPMSYVEISYNVGDPDAQADAGATDNGHESIADTAQITDSLEKAYMPYATFEQNSWRADGSRFLLPNPITQDTGFVSSILSGADNTFSANPVITITFSGIQTQVIPGVTVRWSEAFNDWAVSYIIRVYNGASLVTSQTVTDNTSTLSVFKEDISDYDKITVEVIEWSAPYHRARIEEILVGVVTVFDKSDLMGYDHTQFVDLLSAELPKAEIIFSISNVTGEWNPDAPSGLWRYLLERQQIKVRYGYKLNGVIEWIKAGKFYMSEWDTPQNGITATFTARDALEFMGAKFTTASTTLTLAALASEAFALAGLDSSQYSIDSSLSAITVTLPAEFDYSIAEVIQLCANAACCVFYQDRLGIVIIEPLATALTDYIISKSVSFSNAEYEISKELKSVDINDGMGTASNSATGEVQTASNPLIQNSAVANAVAAWVKDCLKDRKTLSGEFRSDPRLDALDKVQVVNKYATNTAFITTVKYSYNGAFKGEYEGRVIST